MQRTFYVLILICFFQFPDYAQKTAQTEDFYAIQTRISKLFAENEVTFDSLYKKHEKVDSVALKELLKKFNKGRDEIMAKLYLMDFPDIYFNDINDKSWSLSDFKNEKITLNFNYAFCNSCVNFVDSLYKRTKGKCKLIVLFHDRKEDVMPLYEKYGDNVFLGFISQEKEQFYTLLYGTPCSYLLDETRKIVYFDKNAFLNRREKELYEKINGF